MRIVIGADHAGFELKRKLSATLQDWGHTVQDVGTDSREQVDYPDFAVAVGKAINDGDAERGVLICGSGVGASVAANKIIGLRAGLCHDAYSAHQGVEHDDINVLVLGAGVVGVDLARDLLRTFLMTSFCGAERHCRRLRKIHDLEHGKGTACAPALGQQKG